MSCWLHPWEHTNANVPFKLCNRAAICVPLCCSGAWLCFFSVTQAWNHWEKHDLLLGVATSYNHFAPPKDISCLWPSRYVCHPPPQSVYFTKFVLFAYVCFRSTLKLMFRDNFRIPSNTCPLAVHPPKIGKTNHGERRLPVQRSYCPFARALGWTAVGVCLEMCGFCLEWRSVSGHFVVIYKNSTSGLAESLRERMIAFRSTVWVCLEVLAKMCTPGQFDYRPMFARY